MQVALAGRVEYAESHGDRLFDAVCKLGLGGIVSKKLTAPYRSGPSRSWIKVKNPKALRPHGLLMAPFRRSG